MVHHRGPKQGPPSLRFPLMHVPCPKAVSGFRYSCEKLFIYDVIIYLRRLIKESWVWSSTARAGESQTLALERGGRRRRVGFLFESTSIPKFFPLIWNSVQTTTVVFSGRLRRGTLSLGDTIRKQRATGKLAIQLRTTDHERKVLSPRACRVSNRFISRGLFVRLCIGAWPPPAWSVSWHLAHNLSA